MPCDPAVPLLGWSSAPDGEPILRVGPVSASGTSIIELSTADDADGSSTVLWQISRDPDSAPAWNGTVTLGDVPPGFTQAVPLTEPVPRGAEASVSNGCYFGSDEAPVSVPAGVITTQVGAMSPEAFARDDGGFTPCPSSGRPQPNGWGWAVMVAGAGLLAWRAGSARRLPYTA
ncbi:hypothetical protein [Xylanimonas sp. McL0601]|uniref:hypothetical protein n=1 Tax=Xylanimonas sp. McL0601 TaxID=3414739 RepID=UPI003CEF913F